jgi:hypothetical protein
MLLATVDGERPGHVFSLTDGDQRTVTVAIESVSEQPVSQIQILVNGSVVDDITPELTRTHSGAWQAVIHRPVQVNGTSWLAVRSIEPRGGGRRRFAHTGPWHYSCRGQPMIPRREQVAYFVALMEAEIARNKGILTPAALAEFEQARDVYLELLSRAK